MKKRIGIMMSLLFFATLCFGNDGFDHGLFKKRFEKLVDNIKEAKKNNSTLPNILFSGLKDDEAAKMFAKKLAEDAVMQYAEINACCFKDINTQEELFKCLMLERYGETCEEGGLLKSLLPLFKLRVDGDRRTNDKFLIFVNGSNVCFPQRIATFDKSSIELVNSFLSFTGKQNTKYMFVLSSYAGNIDRAVICRMREILSFPGE